MTTPSFLFLYEQLKSFKEKHGHLEVPLHPPALRPLALWTMMQWEAFPELEDSEVKQKLAGLGFCTETNKQKEDRIWKERFRMLEAYKEEHDGNTKVPARYQTEDGVALGKWVSAQRQAKKNEKLPNDREVKLNEIGFVWKVDENKDKTSWDDKFEMLKTYQEQHDGDTRVPKTYKEGNVALGWWVIGQRRDKKRKKLREDREAKLNEVGFVWEIFATKKRGLSPDESGAEEPAQKSARLDEDTDENAAAVVEAVWCHISLVEEKDGPGRILGKVELPSPRVSFENARHAVLESIDASKLPDDWRFVFPKLGMMSTQLEQKQLHWFLNNAKGANGGGSFDDPAALCIIRFPY